MSALVGIIAPVFGLLALGYAATFTRLLEEGTARVLAGFVYWFAIPVLLFRSLARAELPADVPWDYLAAYFTGSLTAFAAGVAGARLLGRRRWGDLGITGFSACFGNTLLLGTPVILTSLGEQALLPWLIVIAIESPALFALVTVFLERERAGRASGGMATTGFPLAVARGIVTNPILVSMAAGIAWNAAGWPLPRPLDRWAELLGGAAIPCALFASGAALRSYRLSGAVALAALMTGVKLILQPLIVYLVATRFMTLPPLWVNVVVIGAAMPVGVNAFLFATRYDVGQAESAAAILLSTVLAVLTLSAVLLALGVVPEPG